MSEFRDEIPEVYVVENQTARLNPQFDEPRPQQPMQRPARPQQPRPANAQPQMRSAAPRPHNPNAPRPQRPTQAAPKAQPRKGEKKAKAIDPNHEYTGHLTPKLMLLLAAPHTWVASIMPVILAVALCVGFTGKVSVVTAIILLAISILMQSAVNVINDYFDYVKGTDTIDNQDDPEDAVLVYNDIDPTEARNLAIMYLGAAFVLGIYIIVRAGWIPLVIALVGALVVFLYSGGRTPISYLPIGEFVSGIVMGGLITLASYQALTLVFDWAILLLALPVIIGIGLIMFTNNTCDIEKDIPADRKTLSVVLGRKTARKVYHALMVIMVACIILFVGIYFPGGELISLFMVFSCYPVFKMLWENPLIAPSRGPAMGQVVNLNIMLGTFYSFAIIFGHFASMML